jgi:hypothetical protein
MFTELGPLLPPRHDEAPGAIAWSEDGQLEHLAALAGLTPVAVTDVPNPLIYPDLATAVPDGTYRQENVFRYLVAGT